MTEAELKEYRAKLIEQNPALGEAFKQLSEDELLELWELVDTKGRDDCSG